MQILLINQDATIPPAGYGGRSFHFYKKLSESGHHVKLICALNTHLNKTNVTDERASHSNIISVFTLKYKKSDSVIRILNWILFMLYQIVFGLRCFFTNKKYDVVYYSSPSLVGAIGGFILAKLVWAKFVFEFRDIWPLTLIEIGNYKATNLLILLFARVEKFMIAHADLIISPLPGAEKYVREKFGRIKNVVHIPNGVDLHEVSKISSAPNNYKIEKSYFNIAYTGSLGQANRTELLIAIAKEIERSNFKIKVHIAGSGLFSDDIKKLADGSNSLVYHGSLPKDESIALLRSCDASIILWHFRKLYQYGIAANKIFEYMACGSPIISVFNGENDPVGENNCGVQIPFDSPTQIVERIQKIIREEKKQLIVWGNNGLLAAHKSYNYDILSVRLEKQLERLIYN